LDNMSRDLRQLLQRTDGSAPSIQASAAAMMRHYDKSPGVAVTEWRNSLQHARMDQHLPLLYVANEVLQNSKRNRGNKFLEVFSPVLGQSLQFICNKGGPQITEKVRRTVKIWGERRVFSVRYVNELIEGLEPYRRPAAPAPSSSSSKQQPSPPKGEPAERNPRFSPLAEAEEDQKPRPSPSSSKKIVDVDAVMAMDDDDSDDDGLFGGNGGGAKLLDISIDMDQAAAAANSNTPRTKRRRSSTGSSGGGTKHQRRKSILSTNTLMGLWQQLAQSEQDFDHAQSMLADLTPEYLDIPADELESLVGDELTEAYAKTVQQQKIVLQQRRLLHQMARDRKAVELEAVRYLPWLETMLKTDKDDLEFCKKLMEKVETFSFIHGPARAARDERLAQEAEKRAAEEALRKQKEEEEERKRFMEAAMKKETEAQPGMVWNKATGEYQYLQTDESWRD
jgi:hypothetical protein